MNSEIFLIIICYIILAFLLLLFNLRTNFHWMIKSTMIVLTTLFYILTYDSFKNLIGWPSNDPLPDRFRLVAAQIYEPNALLNSEGSIFLWITDMDDLAGLSTPRSHSLKYKRAFMNEFQKHLLVLRTVFLRWAKM